ncbi:MAG: hypothetical protein ACAH95_10665 [Fimbriimonas sp.]
MLLETLPSSDLQADERVLWSARPLGAPRFGAADVFTGCFGLFFAGFALFWMLAAAGILFAVKPTNAGAVGYIFPLFGLPFFIVGIYIAFGRRIVEGSRAGRTVYALTNKRIIKVIDGNPRKFYAFDVSRVVGTQRETRPDGSGTLTFQVEGAFSWDGQMQMNTYRTNQVQTYQRGIAFENVPDVDALSSSAARAMEEARAMRP